MISENLRDPPFSSRSSFPCGGGSLAGMSTFRELGIPAGLVKGLEEMGITDATWLQAVREHHTQEPGPLRPRTPARRLARHPRR